MQEVRVLVEGMTCSACTNAVTLVIEKLPGINSVLVNLATETAIVTHDGTLATSKLLEAIEDAGFGAQLEPSNDSVVLQIGGMTCSACSSAIETVLDRLPGTKGTVNLITEQANISYDQRVIGIRDIISAIEDAGFDAIPNAHASSNYQVAQLARTKQTQEYRKNTLTCVIFGIPLIVISKASQFHSWNLPELLPGLQLDSLLCFLLVLPIQICVGGKMYSKAWKAWQSGAPNMDVLVCISITFAFAFSAIAMIYSLLTGQHKVMLMWDACAMILLFVSFGKYMENKARGETSKALSSLLSLVPEHAILISPGEDRDSSSQKKEISTDLLQVGDTILVRPGAKIPVDGVVVEGNSFISEAILTGESAAIKKSVSCHVYSGTVNGSGALLVRVTSCGAQTKLGQVVELIKEAQANKAPIQRFADRVAGIFVYGVLFLATITFLIWTFLGMTLDNLPPVFHTAPALLVAFRISMSVVVVACPCALGLATPTAVMVGSGVGAKHGILAKGGAVFESLSAVDIVLLDKTGTVTEGKMSVISTTLDDSALALVSAVETSSEHPVAAAVTRFAHKEKNIARLDAFDVKAIPGRGALGTVEGHQVLVGNYKFMQENCIDAAESLSPYTQSFVAVDGEYKGIIYASDKLRAYTEDLALELQSRNIETGLISGDQRRAVQAVASACGIDERFVWSEQSPGDKIAVVKELQSRGYRVCMVGDGVNDSPALAAADVGISLQGATQVAVESAGVVLMCPNPIVGVIQAIDLSRSTLGRIKQNFFLSIVYNSVLIPVSMGALIPWGIMLNPINASAAMALSSVSVVCSSLVLKTWQPQFPTKKPSAWERAWQFFRKQPRAKDVLLEAV